MPTWPMLRAEVDRGLVLGEAISRVRRSCERKWGASNFELPVSRLAGTRAPVVGYGRLFASSRST